MKMLAGVLVVSAVLLSACGAPPAEGTASEVAPANLQTTEQALRGDCSVSVQCADGTSRSCNGTSTSCSVGTLNGIERVTCNGNVSSCPTGPVNCNQGAYCTSNSQCGTEAVCVNRVCLCT